MRVPVCIAENDYSDPTCLIHVVSKTFCVGRCLFQVMLVRIRYEEQLLVQVYDLLVSGLRSLLLTITIYPSKATFYVKRITLRSHPGVVLDSRNISSHHYVARRLIHQLLPLLKSPAASAKRRIQRPQFISIEAAHMQMNDQIYA